jgi:hypothetical protein
MLRAIKNQVLLLRTLKEKLWRVFTARGQYIYYGIIDDIIQNYNNCYHRRSIYGY